ncbi:hypothetical protein PoB_005476800 [Plakobranchus ocellatus]|uniref:Uncharacterized protein n=1 Tax=Plakobranchus ocellatus TaxID=259542 RepID=A0AAV4C9R4_9GAST|nr:hypothetical protein PoB_005476800 [Plakobranchus ocellatus]
MDKEKHRRSSQELSGFGTMSVRQMPCNLGGVDFSLLFIDQITEAQETEIPGSQRSNSGTDGHLDKQEKKWKANWILARRTHGG